jgi:hypothetical protein
VTRRRATANVGVIARATSLLGAFEAPLPTGKGILQPTLWERGDYSEVTNFAVRLGPVAPDSEARTLPMGERDVCGRLWSEARSSQVVPPSGDCWNLTVPPVAMNSAFSGKRKARDEGEGGAGGVGGDGRQKSEHVNSC